MSDNKKHFEERTVTLKHTQKKEIVAMVFSLV